MVSWADARRQLQTKEGEVMGSMMDRMYTLLIMGVLLLFAVCTSDKGEPR